MHKPIMHRFSLGFYLNIALIMMAAACMWAAPHGYAKWVKMEDARRGQ